MTSSIREELFKGWSQPPSASEDQRSENACRVISNAIKQSKELSQKNIEIFIQGSYKNNTNVRLNSDVDICVRLNDIFTTDYSEASSLSDEALHITRASYTCKNFKNELQRTLNTSLGISNVTRGNKAFNIKENSYRITADVVPCIQHRRYLPNGKFIAGTTLYPDQGGSINNFPSEHYRNGVEKNNATNYRYKKVVRILKNLCISMNNDGYKSSENIPSYLNECLAWNTPNDIITKSTLDETIRETLLHLHDHLDSMNKCDEWGQVSELLYLFKGGQGFSRTNAKEWVLEAWGWLNYK